MHSGIPAARAALQLAGYLLWPFDKYIAEPSDTSPQDDPAAAEDLLQDDEQGSVSHTDNTLRRRKTPAASKESPEQPPAETAQMKRTAEDSNGLICGLFCVLCMPLLVVLHIGAVLVLLLPVVTAPMARMNMSLLLLGPQITKLRVHTLNEGEQPAAGNYVMWYGQAGGLGEFGSSVTGQR